MILHDATKIMINSIGADKVLHRGDLIWPTEEPEVVTKVKALYDISGNNIGIGSQLTIWEHNSSTVIFVDYEGNWDDVVVDVYGGGVGFFEVYKVDNSNAIVIKDLDTSDNNIERYIQISVGNDNDEYIWFNIKKRCESVGQNFVYTDKACAHEVRFASPNGESNTLEFFMGETWMGGQYQDKTSFPVRNDGLTGYGKFLLEDGTIVERSTLYGSLYDVSHTFGDKTYNDDDAMTITNVHVEFCNPFVSYTIKPNLSGKTRFMLIRIEYDGTFIKDDTYIMFVQPSQ